MRLDWFSAKRNYEAGVDRGVLYFGDSAVPWNGLVSVDETDTGSTESTHYFDGIRKIIARENGDFGAVVSAYTYPDEVDTVSGYFGFTYRSFLDEVPLIHVVYNVLIQPGSRAMTTLTDESRLSAFSWELHATSTDVTWARPVAHLIIDTSEDEYATGVVEGWLYGTETTDPRLPSAAELIELFESVTTMRITYHGDGSYTASGPDDMVIANGDGTFHISSPTAFMLDEGRFIVDSF